MLYFATKNALWGLPDNGDPPMKIKVTNLIRKEIPLFECNPSKWHGHVYYPVMRPYVSVAYLIPLNIPLRLGYLLWLWCQSPFQNWEPKWYWRKVEAAQPTMVTRNPTDGQYSPVPQMDGNAPNTIDPNVVRTTLTNEDA